MNPLHRRDFLAQAGAATAALAAAGTATSAAGAAEPRATLPASPVDTRLLGKSGVKVSLIGMGTGSIGNDQSSNQVRLGVKEFTRVVRHAIDHGVRFFDVADQYGSHVFLREALKGVPRDQYVLQTKTHAHDARICRSHIERYCLELGVEYLDIVLLHCMTEANWPEKNKGAMEYLRKAKEQGLVRAHGTSCHGMDPLRTAALESFVEVDLARINPEGLIMDDAKPGPVSEQLKIMHDRGVGVVGMKILGEGRINTPDRIDASLKFVLGLGTVDAFVIGFESTAHIDDLIARTEKTIAALKG